MALPYENATSGKKAIDDMQKMLQQFGCGSFGQMMDFETGELLVQFKYRDHRVTVKASAKGYAASWLKEHPYTTLKRCSKAQHEAKAMEIAGTAVYSILRDWIKGQVMAVETGILSFEGAFLGQIMLPSGKTVLEHASTSGLLALPGKGGE